MAAGRYFVLLPLRQLFMNALRSSPFSDLALASALQVFIFSCWLFSCVASEKAACPAIMARAAPIATIQVERLIGPPYKAGPKIKRGMLTASRAPTPCPDRAR